MRKVESQIEEMKQMVNELQDKARMASKRHEEYRKDSEKQIEDLQVENSRLTEAVVQ